MKQYRFLIRHLRMASWICSLATLAIAEDIHDFGTIIRGYSYTNTFVITNEYASALHVSRIRLLCPCVKTVSYDPVIPSGGMGKVILLLETEKIYDRKVRYATMVHMTTNATTTTDTPGSDLQDLRQLVMQATILDDVAVVPAVKEIGTLAAGASVAPFQVHVYSRTGREITALCTISMPAWLGAVAMPLVDDNVPGVMSKWVIMFPCSNVPPVGPLDISAAFTVTLANDRQISLPTNGAYAVRIKGMVQPVFSPEPPLVVIPQVAVSGVVERTVAFPSPIGAELRITGAKSSGNAVVVSALNTNDPLNAGIVLQIRPERAGMIDETVTLSIAHPLQHEVSVRVLGNAL